MRNRITLPQGTELTLDGEQYVLETGEIVINTDYLYSVDDDAGDPSEIAVHASITAESIDPTEYTDE